MISRLSDSSQESEVSHISPPGPPPKEKTHSALNNPSCEHGNPIRQISQHLRKRTTINPISNQLVTFGVRLTTLQSTLEL